MKIQILLFALVLAGCTGGPQCLDCCPPGDPVTTPVQVSCRILRADGGGLSGVSARCQSTDAGALTDSTGAFVFSAGRRTCGIASGGIDCGSVGFAIDGGALTVTDPLTDAGATAIFAGRLTGATCVLPTAQ